MNTNEIAYEQIARCAMAVRLAENEAQGTTTVGLGTPSEKVAQLKHLLDETIDDAAKLFPRGLREAIEPVKSPNAADAPAPEAVRGDRTQWQTGVEGHRPTCSRVRGALALPAYIYIRTGCCTECGARVSLPCETPGPPVTSVPPIATCSHLPGSRTCPTCTLPDDDEASPQALAARTLQSRRYSKPATDLTGIAGDPTCPKCGGDKRYLVSERGCRCSENPIPRRIQIEKLTPEESAIRTAMLSVESLPADTRLTEAVTLLQRARDRVADYVDSVAAPPAVEDVVRNNARQLAFQHASELAALARRMREEWG